MRSRWSRRGSTTGASTLRPASGCRFSSAILPPWCRKTPKITEVLPLLYLHGLSTGDFVPALGQFLGSAAGLSAPAITKLTETWKAEQRAFAARDLSSVDYVYLWADGIHVNIRLEEHKLCLLVLIGVRADGRKELVALATGTESRPSPGRTCCATRARGMRTGADDRRWCTRLRGALREVFPQARTCCWFHKIANVLGALPKSAHPGAKKALAEIWNAEDRRHALEAVTSFKAAYGAKFAKAVAKITDDLDELLTFYDYPAEHWQHLRTTDAALVAAAARCTGSIGRRRGASPSALACTIPGVIGVGDRSCSDRPFPGTPGRGLLRRPCIARSASMLHTWHGAQAGDTRHGLQRVARLRYRPPSHCEPLTHWQREGSGMENALHRFVRLLRWRGVRISIPEVLDAMACAGQPGMMRDREQLRAALRVALIKDRRDEEVFDEIFDRFFALVKVGGEDIGHGHGHGHEDLSDEGALEDFTLSEEPSDTPQQGHEHGKPVDIRDFFDPDDLAQQYNLHQEANKIDLAAMTDEIVLSTDSQGIQGEGNRVQIETDRLHNAGMPREISQQQGTKVDADLSIAQQEVLLGWLNGVDGESQEGTEDDAAALRRRMTGVLAGLPEALKKHLEALMALENKVVEGVEPQKVAGVDRVGEHERMELEESLRRLARSLHGGLTHKRKVSSRGRIDSGRTMRRNMRFDGIPFVPVTVRRSEDKPRLVILADVSLSVRATARFTLHLVHGLQSLFRPGPRFRVRRRPGGDHGPVRGPPRGAGARTRVRRGRARRGRQLRLRRGVRDVPRRLRLRGQPALLGNRPRRWTGQRQ